MADKRLFDIDPLSGAREYFEYDEATDTTIIHREEDVTATLERNKRRQNDGTNGRSASGDFVLQAEIPVGVQLLWLQKYGIRAWDKNHMPAVIKLLNSNEWRYLRCNSLII